MYSNFLWFKAIKELFVKRLDGNIGRVLNHYGNHQPGAIHFFQTHQSDLPFNWQLRQEIASPLLSVEILRHIGNFEREVYVKNKRVIDLFLQWCAKLVLFSKDIFVELLEDREVGQVCAQEVVQCQKGGGCLQLAEKLLYFEVGTNLNQVVFSLICQTFSREYDSSSSVPSPLVFTLLKFFNDLALLFESMCREGAFSQVLGSEDKFILMDKFAEFMPSCVQDDRVLALLEKVSILYITSFQQKLFGRDASVPLMVKELRLYAGPQLENYLEEIFLRNEARQLIEGSLISSVKQGIEFLECVGVGQALVKRLISPFVRLLQQEASQQAKLLLALIKLKIWSLGDVECDPKSKELLSVMVVLMELTRAEATEEMRRVGISLIQFKLKALPDGVGQEVSPLLFSSQNEAKIVCNSVKKAPEFQFS